MPCLYALSQMHLLCCKDRIHSTWVGPYMRCYQLLTQLICYRLGNYNRDALYTKMKTCYALRTIFLFNAAQRVEVYDDHDKTHLILQSVFQASTVTKCRFLHLYYRMESVMMLYCPYSEYCIFHTTTGQIKSYFISCAFIVTASLVVN